MIIKNLYVGVKMLPNRILFLVTSLDVTQEGGGNIYTSSILAGTGDLEADGWNVWGTVNYRRSEILRDHQRDFANSFQPDRGVSPDTRGTRSRR